MCMGVAQLKISKEQQCIWILYCLLNFVCLKDSGSLQLFREPIFGLYFRSYTSMKRLIEMHVIWLDIYVQINFVLSCCWCDTFSMMDYSIGHGNNRHLAWSSSSPLMFLFTTQLFFHLHHIKRKIICIQMIHLSMTSSTNPTQFQQLPNPFWYRYAQNQNLVLLGFQLPIESLGYTSNETWKN